MDDISIVVSAYNRKHSLERCLKALSKGIYTDEVRLIISIDRSDTNRSIVDIANQFSWIYGRKKVIYQDQPLGLKDHILACGDLTERYGTIIMLEDDIYVSPLFYDYAKQAARYYWNDEKIAGISLYSPKYNETAKLPFEPLQSRYDVYFGGAPTSWGQLWTPGQWAQFSAWYKNKRNTEIDPDDVTIPPNVRRWKKSWKQFFYKYMIRENKYFVYPYTSFSTNFADPGTHIKERSLKFQVPLAYGCPKTYNFCSMDRTTVIYDAFFENVNLRRQFARPISKEITIDLWGTKSENSYRRYVLTTKTLPGKVLRTFDGSMLPIEDNVIQDIAGTGITLYDMDT